MLVAFEGIDGSGKSTLIRRVASRLRAAGLAVHVTREPTASWLGKAVRRGIRTRLDPLAMAALFVADRADHVRRLERHLAAGRVVLVDRYVDSTTAYQAAALTGRLGQPLERLRALQADLFPRPDRVILLDLPPRDALGRIRDRQVKEPFEKQRFLERVRANYLELARLDARRWRIIDARRPVGESVEDVVRLVARPARRPPT